MRDRQLGRTHWRTGAMGPAAGPRGGARPLAARGSAAAAAGARFGRFLCVALLAFSAACATAGARHEHEDRELLTREQIVGQGFTSAYDAVEALRSNWLTARGPDTILGTPTEVVVYYDASRLGGVETLRWIPPTDIAYIRHYDGKAATTRWGVGHGQGVIYVSTHPM